jgi:hypothetical protein
VHSGRRVQTLNRIRPGAIAECRMEGDWHRRPPMCATSLPNPNSAIDPPRRVGQLSS